VQYDIGMHNELPYLENQEKPSNEFQQDCQKSLAFVCTEFFVLLLFFFFFFFFFTLFHSNLYLFLWRTIINIFLFHTTFLAQGFFIFFVVCWIIKSCESWRTTFYSLQEGGIKGLSCLTYFKYMHNITFGNQGQVLLFCNCS